MEIKLKRGYSVSVMPDNEKFRAANIVVLGNYSKSNYNATPIVSKYGIAPAVRENHGQVTAIMQEFEMNYEKSIRLGDLFDTLEGKHQAGSVWDRKALAPTIDTMKGGMRQPLIVEMSKKEVNITKYKFGWLITGGRNAHMKRRLNICPTILRRISQGYDTYGIPGVVEISKYEDTN